MSLPEVVAVVGAGRMGAGIAHLMLARGAQVVLVEPDRGRRDGARDVVAGSLAKAERAGDLDADVAEVLARLRTTPRVEADPAVGLVVEAVPETLDLKIDVLGDAAGACPGAWLATNTSSLPVAAMAQGLPDPRRLIGLHFFNPVPRSDLLEIVVSPFTAAELVDAAGQWAAHLGKTAITVADSPGFASSRLGVSLALEAMRMVEQGVASASDIDTAMTLGYRHPTGPLRTTDIVGLDVRLAIAEHLHATLGPAFEPPALLRSLVAAGRLGRKTGQGFFSW